MRPIALLTMTYRMVTNMLRPQVGQCDILYAEERDWAVANRGAEAPTFHETMESELLIMSGGFAAGGLVDLSKLYDRVGVHWLMKAAGQP